MTLDNYRLSDEQLLDFAKMATQVRLAISQRVSILEEKQNEPAPEQFMETKFTKTKRLHPFDVPTELVSGAEFNPMHPTRKRRALW